MFLSAAKLRAILQSTSIEFHIFDVLYDTFNVVVPFFDIQGLFVVIKDKMRWRGMINKVRKIVKKMLENNVEYCQQKKK